MEAITNGLGAIAIGFAAVIAMRRHRLHWSWAALAAVLTPLVGALSPGLGVSYAVASATAAVVGARWHGADLRAGGDLAQRATARAGPLAALRHGRSDALIRRGGWIGGAGMIVGVDGRGTAVRIPLAAVAGAHTLVVGATGSGKTVTQAWIAARAIERGHGAVVVDPKGDPLLYEQLRLAALGARRPFIEWTPDGPAAYNPYARGSDTEIADKALAGERYSEPYYLRLAQRYLGHELRALRAGGVAVSPATLVRYLEPIQLEVLGRRLADETDAQRLWAYLDSLSPRQLRDLGGTRDRLAIVAESDVGRWLEAPAGGGQAFDLLDAVRRRAVVYFRLDADRRPLLAQMLAAAIVADLVTTAAQLQAEPLATLVAIDEFSAIVPEQVARLFGRARAAGFDLVLGSQEISDLRLAGRVQLLEQVLGNVAALIAHRQVVPDSAELVAGVAGTHGVWVSTQQVEQRLTGTAPAPTASRTRVREYLIHPDQIKSLPTGSAAVIVPASGEARIARIIHPDRAR